MIKDANSNEVGFVFPRRIAIDYRNLIVNYVPALEDKIELQEMEIAKTNQILGAKDQEINLLKLNIADERKKFEQLNGLQNLYEKEIRSKKFWRTATYILAGSTGILTLLVLAK